MQLNTFTRARMITELLIKYRRSYEGVTLFEFRHKCPLPYTRITLG